jgi:hypothetical protein
MQVNAQSGVQLASSPLGEMVDSHFASFWLHDNR